MYLIAQSTITHESMSHVTTTLMHVLSHACNTHSDAEHKHEPQAEPVYILEIGSGHGKFSYLVLLALMELSEFLPSVDVTSDEVSCDVYLIQWKSLVCSMWSQSRRCGPHRNFCDVWHSDQVLTSCPANRWSNI